MAVSDQLYQLASRAKQAETDVAAARGKAKAELEADVKAARDSAGAQAAELREKADATGAKVSSKWHDAQRTWNEKIANAREDISEKRAEHDLKEAQKSADAAESDAAFAIDFAYVAIEEAEYEVLDAILARAHADELVSASA